VPVEKTLLGRPSWLWKACYRTCWKALHSRVTSPASAWAPALY